MRRLCVSKKKPNILFKSFKEITYCFTSHKRLLSLLTQFPSELTFCFHHLFFSVLRCINGCCFKGQQAHLLVYILCSILKLRSFKSEFQHYGPKLENKEINKLLSHDSDFVHLLVNTAQVL